MKRRMAIAVVLLLAAFSILVAVSGAPLRVHVARGLTWLPPILAACAVLWSKRLMWQGKVIAVVFLLAVGALVAIYGAIQVIGKAEFTIEAYFGIAVFLGIAVAGLAGGSFLCDQVLMKLLRSTRAPRGSREA